MLQIHKTDARYIVKTALVYCSLSMAFSFVGIFLAEKGPLQNPVGGFTIHEILGHLIWGLVAGAAALSVRYFILTGLFAILIDSDHLIGLLHVDAVYKMSHSISFGMISVVVLMILFGKKDYRLAAAAMAGLLAHFSFDAFSGNDAKFPIFVPFYSHQISFPNTDWIYFEIAAVAIVGFCTIITRKKESITA